MQDLHVAGIGSRTVERLGREADAPHFLGAQRIFEIAQPCAAKVFGILFGWGQEQVPQPFLIGACLQFLDHRRDLPPCCAFLPGVGVIGILGTIDMVLHEGAHTVAPCDLPG